MATEEELKLENMNVRKLYASGKNQKSLSSSSPKKYSTEDEQETITENYGSRTSQLLLGLRVLPNGPKV